MATKKTSAMKKGILLSIGKLNNKAKLLPYIKKAITNTDFIFYSTDKTHKYLKDHNIKTSLVYKISQKKNPNIISLLQEKKLTFLINIPTQENKISDELTDGRMIRKAAIEKGIIPITDIEVAMLVLETLKK